MNIVQMRRGMGASGGAPLPYDAEIEYLQSSGTQWIDTLIKESQYMDIQGVYCNLNPGTTNHAGFWGVYNGSFYLEHQYNGFYYSGSTGGLAYTLTNSQTVVQITGNSVYINGGFLGYVQKEESTTSYNIPLFCLRTGATTTIWHTKMKLWYFKILINNILVREYIPVRVGSTGYLYDKVSGQLFGNVGTGAFILGPDK